MLGILTNHHNSALALNDFALFAHRLNGRSYFHRFTSCFAARRRSLVQRAYAALSGCAAGRAEAPPPKRYGATLFASPGDPAAGQIIRGHLDRHLIALEDTDIVHAELAGNAGLDHMAIADVHFEGGVGQGLDDDTLELDHITLRQNGFPPYWSVLNRGRLQAPAG